MTRGPPAGVLFLRGVAERVPRTTEFWNPSAARKSVFAFNYANGKNWLFGKGFRLMTPNDSPLLC